MLKYKGKSVIKMMKDADKKFEGYCDSAELIKQFLGSKKVKIPFYLWEDTKKAGEIELVDCLIVGFLINTNDFVSP